MAGYSLFSPVTPNHSHHKEKWSSNRRYSSFSSNYTAKTNRISTPIGTDRRVSKAKTRLKMSSFQHRDRENYRKMLFEHVKFPNKFVKSQNFSSEPKFNFQPYKTNIVTKQVDSPVMQRQSSLLDMVKSKGLSAVHVGLSVNHSMLSNQTLRPSKLDQIQQWDLPSKSNDFKTSIEKKLDLLYPSKSKEIVESNLSTTIRETKLNEKMNFVNVFKNDRQSITSKIKSLLTPFMSFQFYCKIKNFIPFSYRDYEVSTDALLPVEPQLAPFTDEMQNELDMIFSTGDKPLVSAFSMTVSTKDLRTLIGSSWLNDVVMEFYFNLISLRSQENSQMPSVYSFGTYIFPRLLQGLGLGRWARKIDFFSYDLLLMPVHHSSHWRLLVIDNQNKCVAYYDSLGYSFPQCVDKMIDFLQTESRTKRQEELDLSQWRIIYNIPELPKQKNCYDCGVFACKYAEYIARRAPLSFTQEDIQYFRKCMMYEILHKKLLM